MLHKKDVDWRHFEYLARPKYWKAMQYNAVQQNKEANCFKIYQIMINFKAGSSLPRHKPSILNEALFFFLHSL